MSDRESATIMMLAYNHERFIDKAIEGVIAQDCALPYKLVIAEDCGSDRTRHICEHYAERFPDKVLLLPSERNYGIQANFFRALRVCMEATYIAFCEGDDLWTDEKKLDRQITFLAENPRAVGHAHNVVYKDLRDNSEHPFGDLSNRYLTKHELLNDWPYHVVSLAVRASSFREVPFSELPPFISCDRFISNWLAIHGEVYYEGLMCSAVYHRHDSGASSNSNMAKVRMQDLAMLEYLEPLIQDKALYRATKKEYIRHFYSVAAMIEDFKSERHRLPDFYRYLTSMSPHRFKIDVYILLLILFGHKFYLLNERMKRH